MALLSSARRGRVDGYFAHRLGILGKMVCALTVVAKSTKSRA